MSKEPASPWTQIIVAIITVVGTLGAALLTTRAQLARAPQVPAAQVQPAAPASQPEEEQGMGGSSTPAEKKPQPRKPAAPSQSAKAPASRAEADESPKAPASTSEADESVKAPARPSAPEEAEEPVINLSGTWQDQYGNISVITQRGDTYEFVGRSPTYGLTSQGSGKVRGQQFESVYRTTIPSEGRSWGTVSPDGRLMTGTIQDSALGIMPSTSVRR